MQEISERDSQNGRKRQNGREKVNDIINQQREIDLGELLKKSWRSYRINFKQIFIIYLLIFGPIAVCLGLMVVILDFYATNLFTKYFTMELLVGWVNSFFTLIIGVFAYLAIIYVVNYHITTGEQIQFKDAFKMASSKWSKGVVTELLRRILTLLLFLLFIIPGIIYMVYWMFTFQSVAIDGISGRDALNQSKLMVKGRWWTVFAYILVAVIIISIPLAIIQLPIFLLDSLSSPFPALGRVIVIFLRGLGLTFLTTVLTVYYVNLKSGVKNKIE